MDAKDRQIIRALQIDGRLTNQDLAERVALSPSPCLRRVRQLEQSGVIQGYTALIDQKAYGLPLTVFIHIRLERHSEEVIRTFEERIRGLDEILDCFVMSGDSDYLLRMIAESLEAYERFIRQKMHTIPGIASIGTSFAYGVVKHLRVYPWVP